MPDLAASWSHRLRASDADALTEVFEAWHPDLLRYATRLTRDADAAYDLVQDAFVKLWDVRATLDPAASLRGLLFTMVRHQAFNHNRMRRNQADRLATMPAPPPAPSVEEEAAATSLAERLRQWIDALPPRRREAFQLSRFEGLSHEEIARIMDLTPRTVTNHIMLALQHLRQQYDAFKASPE